MWKVRELAEKVTNVVMNYTETEAKVREATNDDPWGPHGTLMSELARCTCSYEDFCEVMDMLWKRMAYESKSEWRRVYKSLLLLAYLLRNGSERVVTNAREHAYEIRSLESFAYIDEYGKDQGANVRLKATEISELMSSDQRLREERSKCKQNRDKYVGHSGGGGSHWGARSSSDRSYRDEYRSESPERGDSSYKRRSSQTNSYRDTTEASADGGGQRPARQDSRDSQSSTDGSAVWSGGAQQQQQQQKPVLASRKASHEAMPAAPTAKGTRRANDDDFNPRAGERPEARTATSGGADFADFSQFAAATQSVPKPSIGGVSTTSAKAPLPPPPQPSLPIVAAAHGGSSSAAPVAGAGSAPSLMLDDFDLLDSSSAAAVRVPQPPLQAVLGFGSGTFDIAVPPMASVMTPMGGHTTGLSMSPPLQCATPVQQPRAQQPWQQQQLPPPGAQPLTPQAANASSSLPAQQRFHQEQQLLQPSAAPWPAALPSAGAHFAPAPQHMAAAAAAAAAHQPPHATTAASVQAGSQLLMQPAPPAGHALLPLAPQQLHCVPSPASAQPGMLLQPSSAALPLQHQYQPQPFYTSAPFQVDLSTQASGIMLDSAVGAGRGTAAQPCREQPTLFGGGSGGIGGSGNTITQKALQPGASSQQHQQASSQTAAERSDMWKDMRKLNIDLDLLSLTARKQAAPAPTMYQLVNARTASAGQGVNNFTAVGTGGMPGHPVVAAVPYQPTLAPVNMAPVGNYAMTGGMPLTMASGIAPTFAGAGTAVFGGSLEQQLQWQQQPMWTQSPSRPVPSERQLHRRNDSAFADGK